MRALERAQDRHRARRRHGRGPRAGRAGAPAQAHGHAPRGLLAEALPARGRGGGAPGAGLGRVLGLNHTHSLRLRGLGILIVRGGEERDYYRAGVNAFSFAAAAAPSKRTFRATGAGGEFAARRPRGFSAARSARSAASRSLTDGFGFSGGTYVSKVTVSSAASSSCSGNPAVPLGDALGDFRADRKGVLPNSARATCVEIKFRAPHAIDAIFSP